MPENPWDIVPAGSVAPTAGSGSQWDVVEPGPGPQMAQRAAAQAGTGAKESAKEIATSTLPIIGAGMLSAAVPPSAPFAAVLAGGLGGAAGEGYRQIANRILGLPAPKTGEEAGSKIFKEGALQTLWGGAFAGGVGAYNYLRAPGKSRVADPIIKQGMELAQRLGIKLSPGEVLDNSFLRAVEYAGTLTTHGRKITGNATAGALSAASNATEAALNQIAAPTSNLLVGGALKKNAIEVVKENFRAKAAELYQRVDDLAGNAAVVDTKPIADLVERKLLDEAKMMQQFPGAFKRSPDLVELMTDFLTPETAQKIIGPTVGQISGGTLTAQQVTGVLPLRGAKPLTFTEADALRSKWLERGRESAKKDVVDFATQAGKLIQQQMEKAAGKLSPDVLPAWDTARTFYRSGKELMESATYNMLLSKGKSGAAEHIVDAIRPGDITALRDLKHAVVDLGKDPNAFDGFRRQWVANQIGDDITKLPERLAGWGPEFTKEMFGDVRGQIALRNMNDVAEVLTKMAPRSKLAGLEHLQEAHRITNVAGDIALGKLGAVPMAAKALFVPSLIAKVMHSPPAYRYFTEGLSQVPVNAGRALANITRAFDVALKGVRAIESANAPEATPPAP